MDKMQFFTVRSTIIEALKLSLQLIYYERKVVKEAYSTLPLNFLALSFGKEVSKISELSHGI